MLLNAKIIELLTASPDLNALEITQRLDQKPKSVKVILHRMTKLGKVTREKKAREEKTKSGPQNLYVYKVKKV